MEGITGVTHWDEVDDRHPDYREFQKQMSIEVAAACEGAIAAGAHEIWVKDAHGSGRNILGEYLPESVKLIRGWSGHPYAMVQELDSSYTALMMVGYHSKAGNNGHPLAHTMSSSKIELMTINGLQTSECYLHGNMATKLGVPLVFLSGDEGICNELKRINSNAITHATMRGSGNSTISLQPKESANAIRTKAEQSLNGNISLCLWEHPDSFTIQIRFVKHQLAYRASHYPGSSLTDPKTVGFITSDYNDVMRFVHFVI